MEHAITDLMVKGFNALKEVGILVVVVMGTAMIGIAFAELETLIWGKGEKK